MRLILFLALVPLAFAQMDDHILTITASRNVTVTPDQVVFQISLTTPAVSTLDDALALLSGSGVGAADLMGVSAIDTVNWLFTLSAPFSRMRETVTTLAAVRDRINSAKGSNVSMNFSVSSQRTS